MYQIQISEQEYKDLNWLEHRGYTAGLLKIADLEEFENGVYVLTLSEAQAWEWKDNIEDSGCDFGACMGEDLLSRLYDLMDQIV